MYHFKRSERVQELLRHEISKLVLEINDPKKGFVTITSVRLSDDLQDAKVFYSVYGSDEEKENTGQVLRRSVGDIRHNLGRRLESLRRVPTLLFVFDDMPERAQRVTQILNELAHEPAAPSTGIAENPAPASESDPAPTTGKYRKPRRKKKTTS